MGIHTTDAIVLRQYPYRETSVLVTCLTDRFGKLKGIVKGLRGERTRYRSAMEPMTLNRIVFYDTRTSSLHLISQCELLGAFQGLTADLEAIRLAASCVKLTDAVMQLGEPQLSVFELLKQTLERLSSGGAPLASVRIHFALRVLRLAGFHPQCDECTGCRERPLDHQGYWSARQGGLLCSQCLHEDVNAQPIAPQVLELFSLCAEASEPSPLEPAQAIALQRQVDEFLHWRIDRPFQPATHGGNAEFSMRNAEWKTTLTPRSALRAPH